jgi:hypothetical protein
MEPLKKFANLGELLGDFCATPPFSTTVFEINQKRILQI